MTVDGYPYTKTALCCCLFIVVYYLIKRLDFRNFAMRTSKSVSFLSKIALVVWMNFTESRRELTFPTYQISINNVKGKVTKVILLYFFAYDFTEHLNLLRNVHIFQKMITTHHIHRMTAWVNKYELHLFGHRWLLRKTENLYVSTFEVWNLSVCDVVLHYLKF